MSDIEFRDWFPPLVAALAGGILGSLVGGLVGWWGNTRVQREARVARVQMERKRELYQPLYKAVRHSRSCLRSYSFLDIAREGQNRESMHWHPLPGQTVEEPSYSLWTKFNMEGRTAEVSAEIVEGFTRIRDAASIYHSTLRRVLDKWFPDIDTYLREKLNSQTASTLPTDKVERAFYDLLDQLQVRAPTDPEPRSWRSSVEIRGRELLEKIPDADVEVSEIRSSAQALDDAFARAESALEKKIRHITQKYEGG